MDADTFIFASPSRLLALAHSLTRLALTRYRSFARAQIKEYLANPEAFAVAAAPAAAAEETSAGGAGAAAAEEEKKDDEEEDDDDMGFGLFD